jgi:hypothetical protein
MLVVRLVYDGPPRSGKTTSLRALAGSVGPMARMRTALSGEPRTWNTNVARSTDLMHWKKYPHNPIVEDNKSSGIVVPYGSKFRLYTMHDQVDVYFPRSPAK